MCTKYFGKNLGGGDVAVLQCRWKTLRTVKCYWAGKKRGEKERACKWA